MMDIVKVQLSFQLHSDGNILRRRALLTFQSTDTLECVYDAASGRLGGPPLWPRGFNQRLEQGAVARIFLQHNRTSPRATWCTAPAEAALGDLVGTHGANGVLAVLLCIEPPHAALVTLESLDATECSRQSAPSSGHAVADDVASTQVERGSCYSCGTDGASASVKDANGSVLMLKQEQVQANSAEAAKSLGCRAGMKAGDSILYMPCTTDDSLANSSQRCEDEQMPRLPESGCVVGQQEESAASSSSLELQDVSLACRQDTPTLEDQVQAHPCITSGFAQSYMIHPAVSVGGHYQCPPEQTLTAPYSGAASTSCGQLPLMTMLPSASAIVTMTSATTLADALFNMVSHSDVHGVKRLLSLGVDINASTAGGSRVLFRAVMKARDPELVQFLLSAAADVRACDDKGNQVMHFWARATVGRQHLLETGKALLYASADVNAQRAQDCMTPLHHIVVSHNSRRGWFDFHKALFLARCGADIRLATSAGQFPCNLVNMDGRGSTKRLLQLLTAGVQRISSGTMWPRCEVESCPWCQ